MSKDKNKVKKPASSRKNTGQFKPGQSGNPAGRAPGTKNKRTLAIKELCEKKGFDPLEFLIDAAQNSEIEWKDRIKAACEVNACVNPRLKAVELSAMIGRKSAEEMSNEELMAIVNGE